MKCALVTGGSRGIGKAIAFKMAAMGYYVLVNYNENEMAAADTLSHIRQQGGDGELLQFNVAEKDQVLRVLGNWIDSNPEQYIEILVNNAGDRKSVV